MVHAFFNEKHFYKQRQAEIGKKIKQMLSNTPRLNFCYLKIILFLHPRYHPKIAGDILKNEQIWSLINDNENDAEIEKWIP